ncbi:MAG TPA: formylglycine-generating enzyme family protein [Gemmatimonadales bacterium]|nr:formylglycine-generating enzyme family protein [Gemmatimonadales bacterium]
MNTLLLAAFAAFSLRATSNPQTKFRLDSVNLGITRLIIVWIPAGTFGMGTNQVFTAGPNWSNDVERPVHRVTISHDFWMGQFPVTQRQFLEVMGNNPSFFQDAGPEAPVEQVDWHQVQAFLAKVNTVQSRWTVRLPTEAEWEYAARAETTGETYGPLDAIAWYSANGLRTTHPVGMKLPNGFGLYDMLGNVWQWCQDWFGPYTSAPAVDPHGEPAGERRVTRGGCYYCDAVHERAARRNRDLEAHSWRSIGFRIVATPRREGGVR